MKTYRITIPRKDFEVWVVSAKSKKEAKEKITNYSYKFSEYENTVKQLINEDFPDYHRLAKSSWTAEEVES